MKWAHARSLAHVYVDGLFAIEMLIFTHSWEHLVYQMGRTEDVIKHVVKNGKFVYSKAS